jgi:hypothetical protein
MVMSLSFLLYGRDCLSASRLHSLNHFLHFFNIDFRVTADLDGWGPVYMGQVGFFGNAVVPVAGHPGRSNAGREKDGDDNAGQSMPER